MDMAGPYIFDLTDDSKMERIASLLKWQNYRLDGFAVPIDSHYFTYDAASDSYKITLRFWAGTYTSSVYDKLMPSANREDFTVTNLQLKLANGKSYLPDSIGPESYTYPDTGKVVDNKAKTNLSTALDAVHNIGDSTGMAPYLDAAFTIPAADATAVGAVIDTTALTEGAHTLTVTDGAKHKERQLPCGQYRPCHRPGRAGRRDLLRRNSACAHRHRGKHPGRDGRHAGRRAGQRRH